MQDKPALFSTFMMWMLARLYNTLPEAGDLDKPKLVFFFDEAHLLFDGASKAFARADRARRAARSAPRASASSSSPRARRTSPPTCSGQLGNRVQHALRAFTPDDEKALRAAARTFPKTTFYDIEETLTTLGIGEALVTVLSAERRADAAVRRRAWCRPRRAWDRSPTPRCTQRLAQSAQVREYAKPVDRESAREILADRASQQAQADAQQAAEVAESDAPVARGRQPRPAPTAFEQILKSPMTRTVVGVVARGIMGALLGTTTRRRRR